jgi:iron-sulfur cluster assembly protein
MVNMSEEKLITVGDMAAAKIREFMAQQQNKELFLNVELVRTHCMGGAGHAYRFRFEPEIHDGQQTFQNNGIRFAIEASRLSRLRGTTIDYVENLETQGFVIRNPNAVAKCPCGHHDLFDRMST